MKNNKKKRYNWYFLLITIFLYLIIFVINSEYFILSIKQFIDIFIKIIPVLIIVFLLMVLINYYINNKLLLKYLGNNSGIKGWIIAIIAGIISIGPIYIWYPMLEDLKKKGIKNGLITTFLYNRSIKIPLLSMIILYFGLIYTIVLTIIMIIFSVIQGIIIEKIVKD